MTEHSWVILGSIEIRPSPSEVRRIVHSPDDAALAWRTRAKLVAAHGPGCEHCGRHAKDALGTECPGNQDES